jgi:Ca2+-binding EF-hand superfamily protein
MDPEQEEDEENAAPVPFDAEIEHIPVVKRNKIICKGEPDQRRSNSIAHAQEKEHEPEEETTKSKSVKIPKFIDTDTELLSATEKKALSILAKLDEYMLHKHCRTRDLFALIDKDGGGTIESREFGKMIRELIDPLVDDMDVRDFFGLVDPNGDGALDMKELDRIMLATRARTERMKNHAYLFARKSLEDLSPIQRMAAEVFTAMAHAMRSKTPTLTTADLIDTYDKNGNGTLSMPELLN